MSRPEAEPKKVAVALGPSPEGGLRIVASGTGRDAEELVEKAREAGVEVQQDARKVERLLREQGEGSSIPLEIYELMATVIHFAQEVNEARWVPAPARTEDVRDLGLEVAEQGTPL